MDETEARGVLAAKVEEWRRLPVDLLESYAARGRPLAGEYWGDRGGRYAVELHVTATPGGGVKGIAVVDDYGARDRPLRAEFTVEADGSAPPEA